MFDAYRFPDNYLTLWHIGARMGIAPVNGFLRRMRGEGKVRLLDAGCGGGSNSILAALAGFRVSSCDLSPASLHEMRRVARRMCESDGPNPLLADSCALPVATESQDVVIASHIIEHLDDPALLLHECGRVLMPNGVLRLSCPSRFHALRIGRWFGLKLDPPDHKVLGYDAQDIAPMLPERLAIERVTYQGRFIEANAADLQHVVSRMFGLRANPVEHQTGYHPPRVPPLAFHVKEAFLLPVIAAAKLEDALLWFIKGSMISIEIRKS